MASGRAPSTSQFPRLSGCRWLVVHGPPQRRPRPHEPPRGPRARQRGPPGPAGSAAWNPRPGNSSPAPRQVLVSVQMGRRQGHVLWPCYPEPQRSRPGPQATQALRGPAQDLARSRLSSPVSRAAQAGAGVGFDWRRVGVWRARGSSVTSARGDGHFPARVCPAPGPPPCLSVPPEAESVRPGDRVAN